MSELREYSWWQIPNFFTKEQCEKVIELGTKQKTRKAKVGNIEQVSKKIRDAKVAWLEDKWLYDAIAPAIQEACISTNWHIQWDWMESIQFGTYTKGNFYNWHQDNKSIYTKENLPPATGTFWAHENFVGKVRKVSATLVLNSDYEGGEFQLWETLWFDKDELPSGVVHVPGKQRGVVSAGTLIIFPSHLYHRVTPVITGTRHSLVIWCLGKP